jgi:hypothetical protein
VNGETQVSGGPFPETIGKKPLLEPNELVAQIHPRMPVILPEEHHAAWLGEN